MKRPLLLDLFCGAGGAAMGYHRAGFDVVGVDAEEQSRYPFEFHLGDALHWLQTEGHNFDVIHASPPCQKYSRTKTIWRRAHPDLVPETRQLLELWSMRNGRPWVIENVPGSPVYGIFLCGTLFGLRVIRHRIFESNVFLMQPGGRCQHPPRGSVVQTGRPVKEGQYMVVAGHFSSLPVAKKAMGIDWMTRDELAQAIPPAYTEYLGKQLLSIVTASA